MFKHHIFSGKQWKYSLSVRQLLYILLFSALITVVSASIQIFLEYRSDVERVQVQIDHLEKSHLLSLTNSLWNLDKEQIQIQLESALNIPNIVFLEIRENGRVEYSAGALDLSLPSQTKVFPLFFNHNGTVVEIGTLRVYASLEKVFQRLVKRIFMILITQAIQIFLVSFFILLVMYQLVIRHLVSLAAQTDQLDLETLDTKIALNRKEKPDGRSDELDQLVAAFNQMQERLQRGVEQQERAQERIHKRDEMIHAVFEAAQNVALIITVIEAENSHEIIEFSPGAENIFGYERSTIIGTSFSDLLQTDEVSSYREKNRAMVEEHTGFSGEIFMLRETGEVFPVLFSTYPIMDKTGRAYAALCVMLDISERKRFEQQFWFAQKMESIGTMAGGISHHFNNILGIVLGNAELALDDLEKEHTSRDNLMEIKTASLRARAMIRQLLDFSRQSRMEKQFVDIIPVVRESVNLLKSSIPSSIRVEETIPDQVDRIFTNSILIDQIIINLGMNSAHAMPNGGTIGITLEAIHHDGSDPLDLLPGRYIVIRMKDTGCGISPNHIDRVFDPYFTTKPVGEGTGMGLAVVHGIVHDIGGLVAVESTVDEGTEFTIYLPAIKTGEPA